MRNPIFILILILLISLIGLFLKLVQNTTVSEKDPLSHVRISLPASQVAKVNVAVTDTPSNLFTLGKVGEFYLIESKQSELFPFKVEISYESSQLSHLNLSRLTIFHIDNHTGRIAPIADSKVNTEKNVVTGTLVSSGRLVILGLPSDSTSRYLLSELNHQIRTTITPSGFGMRVERTCELIACESMNWIHTDEILSSQYLGGISLDQLGPPADGETICDQCLGLGELTNEILDQVAYSNEDLESIFPERGVLDTYQYNCKKKYY